MERYQACKTRGTWSIVDRLTWEMLPAGEAGFSRPGARALSELLNSLEAQQEWRPEAARWPAVIT